jgi:hypothetical protein
MLAVDTITPYAGYAGQLSILETPTTYPAQFAVYVDVPGQPRTLIYQTNTEHDAIKSCLLTIEHHANRNPNEIPMFNRPTPELFIQPANSRYAYGVRHASYTGSYMRGEIFVSSRVMRVIETMTNDNPIARALSDYWSYTAMDTRAMLPTPTPLVGNFIDFDLDKSTITYLPTTKPIKPSVEYDGFRTTGRVNAKPVRAFRTLFPDLLDGFNDHDFETFNNLFMARMNPTTAFEIVTGEDIRTYYNDNNYANNIGWASCMAYSHCYDYLQIYADNPDKISLVVSLDDEMVTGRALLWSQDDGTHYLDRIYANDDRHSQQFRDFVATIHPDTMTRYASSVTLKSFDFGEYPYMDTFRYLNMDTGSLETSTPRGSHYRELCSTDGSFEEYGLARTYAVRMTRTVTEEMTVYVTADSESDAEYVANSEYSHTSVTRGEMTADDTGGYVSIDDYGTRWYAQDAEHDSDYD